MKCMTRNKRRFFYALYEGREEIIDEYGNHTGQYEVIRGSPVEFWANISAAKGETQSSQFGANEVYDKVIVLDNDAPPIDEYTVLWIDALPLFVGEDSPSHSDLSAAAHDELNDFTHDELASNSKTELSESLAPYDYIVKKVAKSLNATVIAISKVNVS